MQYRSRSRPDSSAMMRSPLRFMTTQAAVVLLAVRPGSRTHPLPGVAVSRGSLHAPGAHPDGPFATDVERAHRELAYQGSPIELGRPMTAATASTDRTQWRPARPGHGRSNSTQIPRAGSGHVSNRADFLTESRPEFFRSLHALFRPIYTFYGRGTSTSPPFTGCGCRRVHAAKDAGSPKAR